MIFKRILQGATWGLALLSVLTYVRVSLLRLTYPLELDCIEGVIMDHVVRLAHGQPIYVAPTLRFIPLAYMPLLMVVSSWITHFFEPAFWQVRLVSFGATVGLMALIGTVIRVETRSWTLAAAGVGAYTLAAGICGQCYDVARPDSLMLFLAFAGLTVLRFTRGTAGAVGAALVMTLAFFTKQHAMLFVGGAGLHLFVNDRRRLIPFAATALVGCLGGFLLLWGWLGDWFRVFTWEIPRGWSVVDRMRIQNYLAHVLVGTLGAFFVPVVASLGSPERSWRGPAGLWWFGVLGGVGTGLLATLDPSAYKHTLIPTVVALTMAGPIALGRLAEALDDPKALPGRGYRGVTAVLAVACLQFVPLLYPVHAVLPHPRAREAHAELMQRLRSYPGEWLMPYHGFYEWKSGKGTSLDLIAFDDIVRSPGNSILKKDPQYLDRMLDSLTMGPRPFAIVTDLPLEETGPHWARIAPRYRLADSLGWISEPLRPVSGNQFAPRYIYLPVTDTTRTSANVPTPGPVEPAQP